MRNQSRIFISYRRSQLARVRPAVEALKSVGIECFFDLEDIDPLADFPERIRQGIAESHALLAWWSRDYGESEHCLAEFKLAWQHARRQSSDVGRRVWVLNPEPRGDHIMAGDLNSRNFLQPPAAGTETAWAQSLQVRLGSLLPEGTLADERQAAPSPRFINVPTSPHEFTGRTAEMLRVHSKLHPARIGGGLGAAVQIHGLGGIGKTGLAAKYAHDFAHAYTGGIVWLNLAGYDPSSPAKPKEAEDAWLKAVDEAFHGDTDLLYDRQEKARPASQVRRLLEQRFASADPYLWVLDNVPVLLPESEREGILAFWCAPTTSGRTLVTTRDSRPAPGFAEERLDALSEDDALRLLGRYRRPADAERPIARELVCEVGSHTLALTLLGEQLRDDPGGYARARERLHEAGALERIEAIAADLGAELGDKARSIIATFAVSIDDLDEEALVVLASAAVCAPNEPIPVGLLNDGFAAVAEEAGLRATLRRWLRFLPFFRQTENRADDFVRAIRQLLRRSLLRRWQGEGSGDDNVEIHPLVADVAIRLLKVDRAAVTERVAAALLARVEVVAADIRGHDRLGPDIRQARHISSRLESESSVWLAIWVGRFEGARGAFALARTAEERALDVGRRVLGEEVPGTIIALNNLAGTLQAQGDLATAQALQEQALKVIRKYLDEDDETMLSFTSNLGTMLQGQGKLAEAKALHERTLEARRRVLGDEHPDTLLSMNNLAEALSAQGELAGAKALQERTLEAYRRVLGEEHPDTLRSMNNLAVVLHAQGNLGEAKALLERIVEIQRRVLGDEHPDTLLSMNNLAPRMLAQGELAGAKALQERTLEVQRRVLGDEHPHTLFSMNNLAQALLAQGELTEARALQERTLEAYRRVLGEEHPDTLRSKNNLALALRAQGDLAEAQALAERVLEAYRRVLGEEHPDTLGSMNNLALVLHEQGDLAGARALHERTLDLSRRILGEEHSVTLVTAWNLLGTLRRLGDDESARHLLSTSALGRLPTLPDESLPADLRAKKPEVASIWEALGVTTPHHEPG